ncbi:hypothetical protein BC826DRAFT_1080739 [Russula brevipes]|nr:hypothetical protein BC826DRAFT_1080739 [Russula brevipes]
MSKPGRRCPALYSSNIPLCPMAPLHSFPLAVSSPLFYPASPSNRVIHHTVTGPLGYPAPVTHSPATSIYELIII